MPDNEWGYWLEKVVKNTDLKRKMSYLPLGNKIEASIPCIEIEQNFDLDLFKYRVLESTTNIYSQQEHRVELMYLPVKKEYIEKYFNSILALGFKPVGIKPHFDDEIVFQQLNNIKMNNLEMKIYRKVERDLIDAWFVLCL